MTRLAPGCKINLGLRITGKLANGYHTLDSIFYPLPWPRDKLLIEVNGSQEFKFFCPDVDPAANSVAGAWRLFTAATGIKIGLEVHLRKRVPIGAGLGGGSADGAAMLLFLNGIAPNPLDGKQLEDLALKLGADVPFFLQNQPCAVSGIGEIIHPVRIETQNCWLVLVYPGFASNTAQAYRAFDQQRASRKEGLTNAGCLDISPFPACGPATASTASCEALDLRNDLEPAVFAEFPILGKLKGQLQALGAMQAAMSGSGSSVYGVFASDDLARSAARTLRRQWPRVYCLPLNYAGM